MTKRNEWYGFEKAPLVVVVVGTTLGVAAALVLAVWAVVSIVNAVSS